MNLPPEAHQAALIVWYIVGFCAATQSLRLLAAALAWVFGGMR